MKNVLEIVLSAIEMIWCRHRIKLTKKYFTMTSEYFEAGKLRKRLKHGPFQGDVAIILRGSVTKCNITVFHESQDSTSCLSALEISYQTVFLPRYNEFIAASTLERSVAALFDPFTFNELHILPHKNNKLINIFQWWN